MDESCKWMRAEFFNGHNYSIQALMLFLPEGAAVAQTGFATGRCAQNGRASLTFDL